jgi:hypothetical protein
MDVFADKEVRRLNLETRLLTGTINPSIVTNTAGLGNGNGMSNEYGSVNARNTVQTWSRVDMESVLGTEWIQRYKTFGMRLVFMNWSWHNSYTSSSGSQMMQVRLNGLPFVNNYDVATKNRKNHVVIIPSTAVGISTTQNFLLGYGTFTFPASSFQLVDTIRYYDLTISYVQVGNGNPPTFTTTANFNYAFPNTQYQFLIWPIEPRKAKIQLNGYPTSQKRIRTETNDDEE